MNSNPHDPMTSESAPESVLTPAEETLRLIASLPAPDDQLDDDTNDADSADVDDYSASPPKTSGLVAAPPDDSN